ncbi:putative DNA-binding domain-containing protein [Aquincola sp. S2]|uniref:DNA-binding domain-containing protein n=1 Tax=Pseudaquabacterium terrae TaxID=2732868 RepID=A0ABX2ELQ0_9BURK|nr:DNA-binding domain-containing protein [Aquabacterium terrae]NRF69524.1 putative DNA-binding domain-containing protein [Aquabacterium terrae]
MNALREQQRAFAAAVADGADAGALLANDPRGGPPALSAYRYAYAARLAEALRDNFEVLARALGDEGFDALARAYIAAHPSTEPSIRWFGHRLADFMAAALDADDGLVPHPALVDCAHMDWALRAAFDAADAAVLERSALAAVAPDAWPGLRFTVHPSVQLVALHWAIEPAWRLLREADPDSGDEPDLPPPQAAPHRLLAWRQGTETLWRSLPDDEATLLQALVDGADFATLCETAATLQDDDEAAPARAVTLLAQWLDEGLLSTVSVPDA